MMTLCLPLLTRTRAGLRNADVRWIAWLALLLLMLLTGLPAQAAKNYTFPGALPLGCINLLNGNYTCGTLTLADYDTVTIASPTPATITFIGAFTAGAHAQINAAGTAADLTINANAAVTIGAHATLNANLNSSAAVNTGLSSAVGGNIVTTLPTGVVTIGASSTVGGYIKTTAGAATVGADSTVNGSITTLAGVVAIGARSIINGAVSTDAGAITTSADVTVKGSIAAQAGVVTIGMRNRIDGLLSTLAGAITIGANSVIDGATSPVGVITPGAYVTSSSNITSGVGAVNIGDYSRLCGELIVYGAGIVTLTTNVKIDGSINTTVGGITVGAGSTVGGNVKVTGAGVVTLTQVLIGGNVSTVDGAITMTASKVRGSVIATGAGVVTLTATTQNDATFSIAPACAATTPAPTPSSAATAFDALESGINATWSAQARKPLYTKLIGVPFTIDIAALKTDGALESAYVISGGAAKYVKLELFDDTGAACSAYANPVAVQSATFASTLFSGAPGRTLSGAFTVANVHRALLVRIKECVDSACTGFTGVVPACSSDRFSVRPPAPTLSTAASMASAPSPTASQTIRAGADFALRASSNPVGAYAGVLTLDASKLTAQLPSQGASAQSGGAVGVLTPSALTANAAATMANYSEAGYLYIGSGAFRDDGFTAVDSAVGDCIVSTANNDYLADTLNGGKYGCSIGNKLTATLGRFVPDHFDTALAPGAAMPCPTALTSTALTSTALSSTALSSTALSSTASASAAPVAAGSGCPAGANPGFIYSGQPFAITITARSLSGTPTINYSGFLARDVTLEALSTAGGIVAAGPAGSVLGYSPAPVAAAAFALGVADASLTYTFPTRYPASALAAPTDIYLRAHENSGVAAADVTSARAVASSSVEAGVKVVSGRLHIANNYGSELLQLPIVVRAQYWDGIRFVNSTTDQKTSFGGLDVKRENCQKNMVVAGKCITLSITAPVSPLMIDGAIRLMLAAPGAGNTGSVDLRIAMFDWLPSNTARIGVGVYKAGPVIYMREMH